MNIGILLSGVSYGNRNRDWRETGDSIRTNVIECWKDAPRIYINTYHTDLDEELLSFYSPVKFNFLSFDNSDARTTMVNGLKLLLDQELDIIIVTRFDIEFFLPISSYEIDYNKFNFLFKELDHWDDHMFVCDNLFVFPTKFLQNLIDAIQEFYDHPYRPYGDLHPVYRYIVKHIDEASVNFMSDAHELSHSNTHYILHRS